MNSLPITYREVVRKLHIQAASEDRPINGAFELTERCNLSCRMCYVRKPAADINLRLHELSAAQWLDLARAAVDRGMLFLLLTGGEVFLRPDFFEIYTPLTRLGLMISLFTNGTLITDHIASRLAESPPSRTDITLYGATAETYEAVTGVPGSYERCLVGIEALVKKCIPLRLKTTITRRNRTEVEDMRRMARDWGLPFSAAWLLTKRRDGGRTEVEDCRMSAEECLSLHEDDRVLSNRLKKVAPREPLPDENGNFYCYAGKAAFVINSKGEMNPCLDMAQPAARPLEIGFFPAWKEVTHFIGNAPPPSPTCLACDARIYCTRCPAWSAMETGTLTEPVPYLCEIARARKARFSHAI